MKELFLVMAKMMPVEALVEKIQEGINEWKKTPTEENLNRLEVACVMLTTKSAMGERSIEDVSKDMEAAKKGMDIFGGIV